MSTTNVSLYDTMRRRKVTVEQRDTPLKLYTCGLTVYARAHVGNWRTYVFNDTLVRTLQAHGYEVERAMNHTDVGHLVGDDDYGEDKLQKAAKKERKTAWEIAQEYIDLFESDMKAFNMVWPQHLVRATDTIEEQIEFVRKLEAKGYTYVIDDGVYFDTSKLKDYGKLAKLKLDAQQEGARVVANPQKKNASDFAVWKFSPRDAQRDMEWESPWGKGFPGWHLECSVIAQETLGAHLDIHTGGIDHIPVHHTNEIAQSEALHGSPFARLWLHAEHLQVEGGKMAKSLDNGYTLSDLEEKGFGAMDFRALALQSHYRTQANFTWKILEDAHTRLKRYYRLAERYMFQYSPSAANEMSHVKLFDDAQQKILEALADDLNTPQALSHLDNLPNAPVSFSEAVAKHATAFFEFVDSVLGLDITERVRDVTFEQKELLVARSQAKEQGDYATADTIREQLREQGIQLDDVNGRTEWGRSEFR